MWTRSPAAADPCGVCELLQTRPQEGRSVARELLLARERCSPDLRCGGELGQRVAERLDHDPAVIADLGERVEGGVPWTCPLPGVPRWFSDAWKWTSTSAHEISAVRGSFSSMWAWNVSYIIRQLGWSTSRTSEAVSSAQFTRYISKRFRYSTAIVTSRVAACSAAARRLSAERSRSSWVGRGSAEERRVERRAGRTVSGARVPRRHRGPPSCLSDPGSHLRIGADRAVVREAGADTERREPELGETLPEALVLAGLGVEDRDLDSVVSDSRSSSKVGVVLGPGHVGRPQHHVHAELRLRARRASGDPRQDGYARRR